MDFTFFTNLYMLICSGFGLFFGIGRFMKKKRPPTYFLFILFAIMSAFLSRIYYFVTVAFYGSVPDVFNVGFIGYAAMFLYMFFANFGQLDCLVDDRRTLKARYRIIPVIIPAVELFFGIYSLAFGTAKLSVRIPFLIISVLAGFAGYMNIKHFIIPDVDFGIIKAIRGYNLLAFLIGIFSLAEIGFSLFGVTGIIFYIQIILGVLYAAAIPLLNSEVKKWTR